MLGSSEILKALDSDCKAITTLASLQLLRSQYLGKGSALSAGMSSLPGLNPKARASAGAELNSLKKSIEQVLDKMEKEMKSTSIYDPIDISRPGLALSDSVSIGHLHPSSLVLAETYQIFSDMGFAIVDSQEIETDWFNFEALNMPQEHPAREIQDTFYILNRDRKLLPRTHTSGMQVRFMNDNKPPFKIIVPGKVFRNENEDSTHSWLFNQIEGLVVGKDVSMADLKGTLLQIVKRQLGPETEIRFRASYFPYTEPSVEVDAKYRGKWLELGGAGMVHPNILRNGGIDPEVYSGFAFGWGVERIAAIKYGISDLRQLWRPRLEYLEQF